MFSVSLSVLLSYLTNKRVHYNNTKKLKVEFAHKGMLQRMSESLEH